MSHFKKMVPMSKGEETVVWMDFVRALPDESYLKPLLAGLDRFLRHCMMNDIVENVAGIVEGSNGRIADLQKELEQVRDLFQGADKDRTSLRNQIEELLGKVRSAERSAEGYRDDMNDAQQKLAAANREIDRLKVMLFDKIDKLESTIEREKGA